MADRRTDLAAEAWELWRESAAELTEPEGVQARDRMREGCPVTEVEVLDERGGAAIGKPPGRYVTLTLTGLREREEDAFPRLCRALAAELRPFLPPEPEAPVLVAGLGNRAVTPDAVGPVTLEHLVVTRHLIRQLPKQFAGWRPVAAVAPGVLGVTGMETQELLRGAVAQLRPACVIAVDALASRAVERVCRTVQAADTGIVPGSGVSNSRSALDRSTLGVPVLAVGVPTDIDAEPLAADVAFHAGQPELDEAALRKFGGNLMVTPRDIDARVRDAARVVGFGLSLALHDGLRPEDVAAFLS